MKRRSSKNRAVTFIRCEAVTFDIHRYNNNNMTKVMLKKQIGMKHGQIFNYLIETADAYKEYFFFNITNEVNN